MSGASNLGYGQLSPFSNVNSAFVNKDNSHSPANFGSNEVPGGSALAGAKSNIDAAAGKLFKGGAKKLKRKIKNITKKYKKMKHGSRKMASLKNRLRTRMASRGRSLARGLAGGKKTNHRRRSHSKKRSHRQRGGYSQYQNNQPFSLSYSVGGVLPASQLALANPPPIVVSNNAVDNYNHYTNTGTPSRGH